MYKVTPICESEGRIVGHHVKMHLNIKVHIHVSQEAIASSEPLLEGSEFELRRESGNRFHFLGAQASNVREPVTVLHRGSAKRFIDLLEERYIRSYCSARR